MYSNPIKELIKSKRMDAIKQATQRVTSEYQRVATKKLFLLDAFLCYCVATGGVQFLYMLMVGTFPFNSFLSGFLCQLGLFACGVSLRLQLTSKQEFSGDSQERVFGDFAFCALVLLFVVFSFLG